MNSLIKPNELLNLINQDKNLVIADVRWYGNAPDKGLNEYKNSHIAGAIFIDTDKELSDHELHKLKKFGRHPLPNPEYMVKALAERGIGQDSLIVAYDDNLGSVASRLWWLMRWVKGPEVKILDGGFQAWKDLNLPVESGTNTLPKSDNPIKPLPQNEMFINKADLIKELENDNTILIDARDKERYLGLSEPIDPVAGHIEGAINSPFRENMTKDIIPKFKSPEEIKEHFESLGVNNTSNIICYCGSGVTACHNILALESVGFNNVKLYPGSWSEWCNS